MTDFGASFLFALVHGLHCAGMCGPLVLVAAPGARAALAYHAGRIAAYGFTGAVAGSLSPLDGGWLVPAVLAIALLLGATGSALHLRIPLPRLVQRSLAAALRLPPDLRGLLVGLGTPLLPCGLLFAAYGAAFAAGSAPGGALVMLGLAFGSLPPLLLAHGPLAALRTRLGPHGYATLRRAAAVSAALALGWRAWTDWQGVGCCS
jgi:hypothetical protein